MNRGCSCIIPAHNEGERILEVLDIVQKIKSIDEVICVDDGSTDNTKALVREHHPAVRLISLPKNVGKTEAVKQGLSKAKGDLVLLLDADLRNLNGQEIEATIKIMQKDRSIDMLVLRRVNAPWNIKLFRGDVLIPGERIMKVDDLQQAIETQKPKRYQLEFAINKYLLTHHKNVGWAPSSAINTWPTSKFGFFKGMYKILAMQVDILHYVGLIGYIRQFLFFCRKGVI